MPMTSVGYGPRCAYMASIEVKWSGFSTQLPFGEYKGRSLWFSLEKGLLSSQLHVCGCATSGPPGAVMADGGGRKKQTQRGALLTTFCNKHYSLGSCCSSWTKGLVLESGNEEKDLQEGKGCRQNPPNKTWW